MTGVSRRIGVAKLMVKMGPSLTTQTLREQTWFTQHFLGLRCDLESLPTPPEARVSVKMIPAGRAFKGFADEFHLIDGEDARAMYLRQRMVAADVDTLYVAYDDSDHAPIFAQWLVKASSWPNLNSFAPDRYPRLADDEAFVEFAYTFTDFRGYGAMAAGMWQLLDIARASGARSALTYVAPDNVPSLRGCARVGFGLDHVRRNERRLGRRESIVAPLDALAQQAWEKAITAQR